MTSDGELLQRLFEDFINKVGQDKFNKDDKSKKVIGVDDGQSLPLEISSQHWFFDGVIEGESMDFCASLRILRIKQRSR